jgi:hypothetical protein
MPFGILDTSYIDFPPGVDATYVQGLQTRDGVDFARVVTEIDSRLGAANAALDEIVASMIATPTTEISSDTTTPVAFKVNEKGEYTISRPQMQEGSAVMLPLRGYDLSLEFTEDGLKKMSLAKILQNIDGAIMGIKRLQRLACFQRLFSIAEVRVDRSTTATSPGFAGSGSGSNVFSSPFPDGTALSGGYTHYYRDTTANVAVVTKTALANLKRWQKGPFEMVGSQTAIDLVTADTTNFVPANSDLIKPAQGDAQANVDPVKYIGVYMKEIKVRYALLETTDPHLAIYKSNGSFAADNPLAWRYDPLYGKNAYVKTRSMYPLDQAVMMQWFGIGVNNRVSAALIKLSGSGNYTDPTFS